jgi:hypothetical protein
VLPVHKGQRLSLPRAGRIPICSKRGIFHGLIFIVLGCVAIFGERRAAFVVRGSTSAADSRPVHVAALERPRPDALPKVLEVGPVQKVVNHVNVGLGVHLMQHEVPDPPCAASRAPWNRGRWRMAGGARARVRRLPRLCLVKEELLHPAIEQARLVHNKALEGWESVNGK